MPRSKVELFAATRQGSPFLGVALTAEQAAWVRAAAWRSFHRKTYMLRLMEARRTKALQQDTARVLNEGRREVIKGGVVRDDQFQRTCQAVRRKLDRAGGWVPGKVARDAISRTRAISSMTLSSISKWGGEIEVETVEYHGREGVRVRLKEGAR